jgi:hypothetical protein
MNNDILKINILSIALSGLIMMVSGGVLYYFRGLLSDGIIRYFLPIPPIAVAAYIFVFNMFKHQNSCSPVKLNLAVEMFLATVVSSSFFFIFVAIMILVIINFK